MQQGIQGVLLELGNLINLATPIVVALALLYFFWGLATYILTAGGGEAEGKKKGRDIMIWGILALFIMVSIWGIINIVRQTFNLDQTNIINVPGLTIPGSQQGGGQTTN